MQLSILISEKIDFLVTAACNQEVSGEIERTKISVMTLEIFAEFEHWFGSRFEMNLNEILRIRSDKEFINYCTFGIMIRHLICFTD